MSILRQCNTFKLDLLTLLFSVQPIGLIRAKFLLNAAHSADFHTQIVFFPKLTRFTDEVGNSFHKSIDYFQHLKKETIVYFETVIFQLPYCFAQN